jgi:tyrosine-protein kinase Etk/Wzc
MREDLRDKGAMSLGDLKKFLPVIRKNWWLVLLLGGLAYFIGRVYVYKLNKIFAVSTQLLLKSNDDYSNGSLITDNRYYGGTYKTYVDNSNEIRVLQSQDMIEKTLERLDFDVSYYLVGRLRTTEVYSGVPFSVKVVLINPALYEQQIKFNIGKNDTYTIEYVLDEKVKTAQGKFGENLLDPNVNILVTKKNAINLAAFQQPNQALYLIQPHRMDALTKKYLSSLRVENPEYTNVLKLTLQDVLTERAVRFLDTLSQVYIENSVKSRLEINSNTVYYIDRQMDEVANILNNIEDTLQRFKEKNSVIDLNKQSDNYFERYMYYLDFQKNIGLKLATLSDLERYIIEDKDPAFLPPDAYAFQDDNFQISTLSQLYDQQKQLNASLQVAKAPNFAIQQLKNQIDSTKRDLLVYIKNTRKALHESEHNVEEQINYYAGELHLVPEKQRGLLNITRKQRVNEDMYIFLLQRRANTIISRASIVPETKIIERPRPSGVVSPDEDKLIYSFTGVGILLGLIIAAIRVLFFFRIESYEELKNNTRLPILGDVVYDSVIKELPIAVETDPKSPMAESFRTIRTNLQYMATGDGPHLIVITSNSPGEGKTFCSLNLAAVLAKSGKRTILLELDLHKPRVQNGLGIKSEKGISTIAAGKHDIGECIVQTRVEGLDALLSGPLPPNPSELISSKKMDDILDYCKLHYDYIIIDTPPVALISDALVLMNKSSVLLFVLNTKASYRSALENAEEIATLNSNLQFGFILNGVRRKKSKYYYNRYGYGYGSSGGGYGGYGNYGGNYGTYGNYGVRNRKVKVPRTDSGKKKEN